MIIIGSNFNVIDNTGVKKILWIGSIKSKSKIINLGDIIIGVVKQVTTTSKFKKSQIVKAIVVNLKKPINLNIGISLKFNMNSVILIDTNLNPLGTRILGFIPRVFKTKQLFKITSIAWNFI